MIFNDMLAKASSIRVNRIVSAGSAHNLLDPVISFTRSYQASIEVTSCHMHQCCMPATVTLQSLKSAVTNLKSVLTVICWIVMGFGAFATYILSARHL